MSDEMTLGPVLARTEEPNAEDTVFGRFLLAIKAGQRIEQPLMGGQVIWCDEPVELIALSGLWVIMHKLAGLNGESITTQVQASVLAERVNRLVSAGIVLVHETPEAAAEAFRTQVILLTRRAHTLGYRPGMNLPVSAWTHLLSSNEGGFIRALPKIEGDKPASLIGYWQVPSTLFFAGLVRAARDLRTRLRSQGRELLEGNLFFERGFITCLVSARATQLLQVVEQILHYLDETREGSKQIPEGLHKIRAEVRDATVEVALFWRMHIQPRGWPETTQISLDWEWLSTQILLAYTSEGSDADVLPGLVVYRDAVRRVQVQDDDTVLERVIERLRHRFPDRQITASERAILEQKIVERLQSIRTWDPDQIDDQTLAGVLMVVSDKEFLLDPGTAYQVATGIQEALLEQVRISGLDTNEWLAGVGMAILWSELSRTEVEDIVTGGVLPDLVILDGLAKCEASIGTWGVRELLSMRPSSKSLNHTVRLGLVEVNVETIRSNVGVLDPEILGERLAFMLDHVATAANGEFFIPTLWTALTRAPRSSVEGLLRDRVRRPALCDAVKMALENETMSWNRIDHLREHLGEETFRKLILGAIAKFRDCIRSSPEAGRENPWLRVIGTNSNAEVHLRVLGKEATVKDARRLLTSISEAEALAWAKGEVS